MIPIYSKTSENGPQTGGKTYEEATSGKDLGFSRGGWGDFRIFLKQILSTFFRSTKLSF